MERIFQILISALVLLYVQPCQADVAATYNSATDVPVTASSFSAAGAAFSATLNFAPSVGTNLTVVKITGLNFINGTFTNLAQGQVVTLNYDGINYKFIANYYGGTGNDLVLQWGNTRLVAWGYNGYGQLGDGSITNRRAPVDVLSSGALAGKTVLSVTAGEYHSLALCSDGTVAAWGDNNWGQLGNNSRKSSSVPVLVDTSGVLSDKTVVAIAAGKDHSLALCSDGTVAAWGINNAGGIRDGSTDHRLVPMDVSTTGVLAGKTVVTIAAGNEHSLALCSDGAIAAWGLNESGQLGNNSTEPSNVPIAVNNTGVLSGKTVVAVAAGRTHSLALCSDGTVASWGNNSFGQLGNNNSTSSTVPMAVNTTGVLSGKTVVAVAAGAFHNLALCSDGTVASWGNNVLGQLGNNSTIGSIVPMAVNTTGVLSDRTVVAVTAGEHHSLALCSDGTIAGWGHNNTISSSVPVKVSDETVGRYYKSVSSGAFHILGLIALSPSPVVAGIRVTNITKATATLHGTVNPNGSAVTAQFEYGTTTNYGSRVSVVLSPDDGLIAQNVSVDLTGLTLGTIYHYRLSATNALGTFSSTDGTFATSVDVAATFNSASDVPVTANDFSAAGANFSATLNFTPPTGTTLMVVKNTGLNFIHGTFSNLSQGQVVTLNHDGINYRFIANYFGGSGNDLVLQWANTRLVAWGDNGYRQLGDGGTTSRFVPVDVLTSGALAGKTVLTVAAGSLHTLALCSDGTIAAWGNNSSGQLGNNSTTSSSVPVTVDTTGVLSGKTVISVAAGLIYSLALCSDGTIAAWGHDETVPRVMNTAGALSGKIVVAVAAGQFHNVVLCSDGTVATWASNDTVPVAVNTAGALSGKTVVAIAAGEDHSLALCSDGTIATWVSNDTVPIAVNTSGALAGKTVVAVAAGSEYNLARCSDGTIATWSDSSMEPIVMSGTGALSGKTVISAAAGRYHRLALCSDGTAAAWGNNSSGQLGNNSTTNSSVPVTVSSSPLAAGERYAAIFTNSTATHNFGLIALSPSPVVAGIRATNLTKTTATLHGTVNPNGSAVTAQFEYGTTTDYGSRVSAVLSPNDGLTAQNVRVDLTDLTPGTIYHYRLTATNALGTFSSADGTFVTSVDISAIFNSASDVPVTASNFSTAGANFSATLNFAPTTGTTLTVVKNTGLNFIHGMFNNVAQGQVVTLNYNGINYRFIANYFGGTGNDLVLQWANTRLVAWGYNGYGQLGDGSTTNRLGPVDVLSSGALAGKTVLTVAVGSLHTLALCSDGTVAAWGSNSSGQLGNNSTTNSSVPVAVNTSGVLSGKTVIFVASGLNHTLALCSDGTVAAWGSNSSGQLGNNSTTNSSVPVAVNTSGGLLDKTVISVAAGLEHSLALCSDGTVVAWGSNSSGQLGNNSTTNSSVPMIVNTSGVLAGKTVVSVAAGYSHSLALCSDDTAAAWGNNFFGQLGNGSTTSSSVPVAVDTTGVLSGKTVMSVTAGDSYSLALCSDGTVAAWGSNSSGKLGNGSTTSSSLPIAVDTTGVLSGKTVVSVTAGGSHGLALCSDGTTAAWGRNTLGQLGSNSPTDSSVPMMVSSSFLTVGEKYAAVFSGSQASHNFGYIASPLTPVVTSLAATGLTETGATLNGAVNPNGNATTAQFEYGTTTDYGSSIGVILSPNDGLTAQNVSATLTGLTPRTTYHFRLTAINAFGIVSTKDGMFTTPFNVTVTYHSASDVPVTASTFLATGGIFSATLNFAPSVGTNLMVVKNTGLNFINGTFSNLAQGQMVTLNHDGINYKFIANYYGGTGNDLVLQWANTRPVAWGDNSSSQLGYGFPSSGIPVPTNVRSTGVLSGKNVVAMAAGSQHSLALCSDGTVVTWGGRNFVPVVVSTAGVLSGKTVVAVAAGSEHSLALCSDGTVAAWGSNSSGQLGNNSTTSSSVPVAVNTAGVLSGKTVVAVAAGEKHSLALCSDGTVAAWGFNTSGQLGNGSTTNSSVPVAVKTAGVLSGKTVVAVAAGFAHSLVLCSDGTVAAWGYNNTGQLGNGSTTNSSVLVAVNTAGILEGKTVIAMLAGGSQSLALCSDSTVAAWGYNFYGQLGNNSTTYSKVPVAVNTEGVLAGKTIVALGGGMRHNLALCSDGTVAAWGYNFYGQLGNNTTTDSKVPVAVSSTPLALGERYAAVFRGPYSNHSLGLIASPPAPMVTSLAATDLSDGSAVLHGSVNAAGGSASVFFDYGLDFSYGSTVAGSPSSVTGSTGTAVSASLTGLTPDTTYHYRVRATSNGGTTSGADLTFTTPPDATGPAGGTMTLAPGSLVEAGAALTVTFARWTDPSKPLTYSVLLDDVLVSTQDTSATRSITAPANAGTHTLKGRIYDALGHFTEVAGSFTVISTREDWRTYYFGSPENAGNAADQADPDGDGNSNLFEYVAGLVPTNPLSRFNVRVEMVTGQPEQKAISFGPLAAGRIYTVSYKTDLSDGTWTPLTDIATSDNSTERTIIDFSAGNGQRFYRVEITRP